MLWSVKRPKKAAGVRAWHPGAPVVPVLNVPVLEGVTVQAVGAPSVELG